MQHDFILLDRSGSMTDLWAEAIGSVNTYVRKLATNSIDTGVTLAAFDCEAQTSPMTFETIRDRITPSTWREVSVTEVAPRGFTPLNDAVGKIVALAKAGDYDKVAIIIMTDGQENSSKELTVTQAKLLLDQCRARGWQVIFLGANFDNAAQAASYGTHSRNTVAMGVGNFATATATMSNKRAAYGATGQAMGFSDAEKAELAKAKP
jgi:Mg-chelatase subunit ChlD